MLGTKYWEFPMDGKNKTAYEVEWKDNWFEHYSACAYVTDTITILIYFFQILLLVFILRFYGLLKQYEEGRASGESNRRGVTWMTSRMRTAIVWLKSKSVEQQAFVHSLFILEIYVSLYRSISKQFFLGHVESSGDRMPHEDRICLPSCQSKNEIYKLYLSDCKKVKIVF